MSNIATGELAIAICDRCKRKFPYLQLRPDGNLPGLMVCEDDWDEKDRYRLPPRKPEPFTLRRPRPDVKISTTQDQLDDLEDFREAVTLP